MNLSSLLHVKRNGGKRPPAPDQYSLNIGDISKFNGKYWVVNQSNHMISV